MSQARFRSRARVIDLLGRQQIADAPTAVGELFKNSLDAGAKNVWVDFRDQNAPLTISDDGLGMRIGDVLDKWLVLATDSSFQRESSDDGWAKYATKSQRKWLNEPTYGEKGIGRLSIATLGRQTLLWTVWGEGAEKKGTLCFVHWGLFRHPTMLFEDLPIPILELSQAATAQDVSKLFQELRKNTKIKAICIDERWDMAARSELAKDLKTDIGDRFKDMEFRWEAGTTFFVLNPTDQVEDLFLKHRNEIDPSDDYPPDILKAYHAFSTFWDPFHKHSGRDFRLHVNYLGKKVSRVNRYWQPSDFKECDHHIQISVTSDGFAKGFVQNYGQEKMAYQRQLKALPRGHASPGAFLVEIGYVQGKKSDSFLPADTHFEVNKRLQHAGGFSIYLNNVRIQPYGAIDSDFAGFEQRRLKNAGRYYFSTLRMFGGIFLPSKTGTKLTEKAGREGFVVNGASRGLRLWLEDLFVDVADSFLGSKAPREDKKQKKEEKAKAEAVLRLERDREDYLKAVKFHQGWLRDFQIRAKDAVVRSRSMIAAERNAPPGTNLKKCEQAIEELRSLETELRQTPNEPPDGVLLEGDVLEIVDNYRSSRDRELRNLKKEISNQAEQLQPLLLRSHSREEQEKAITEKISRKDRQLRDRLGEAIKPAVTRSRSLEMELGDYVETELKRLTNVRSAILGKLSVSEIANDKSGELARKFEVALQAQTDEFDKTTLPQVKRLVNELEHLTDNSSTAILLGDQAKTIESLQERIGFLVEMAQVGLILETATHEYEKHVNTVKSNAKRLSKVLNEEGLSILNALSDSFEIIDQRIRLFDPLIRRGSTKTVVLPGREIEEFLKVRFHKEFAEVGLVSFSNSFRDFKLEKVKRPVVLGAIYNLFHNSLYWCRMGSSKAQIRFTITGKSMVISDSGPGIALADRKRIFDPGFSRRPYGRGFGLYIAKEALDGVGFLLSNPEESELGALEGANFVITPKIDF